MQIRTKLLKLPTFFLLERKLENALNILMNILKTFFFIFVKPSNLLHRHNKLEDLFKPIGKNKVAIHALIGPRLGCPLTRCVDWFS